MKIAIIAWIFLGFLTASAITELPEDNETRTTAEIMKEKKISQKDLCDIACQSKFSRCYDKKKQSGFKCAANAVMCKKRCK